MNLEKQYLESMQTARDRVAVLDAPQAREALTAVMEAVSHLHMLVMQQQAGTAKELFDLRQQMSNVLYES